MTTALYSRRALLLASPDPAAYRARVAQIAASNLIAYWPLDEAAGAAAFDSSGNGRHATYSSITLAAYQPPMGGLAPAWGAGSNALVSTDAAYAPSALAISLWVYAESWGNFRALVARPTDGAWVNGGFGLHYEAGAIRWWVGHYINHAVNAPFSEVGRWLHLYAERDSAGNLGLVVAGGPKLSAGGAPALSDNGQPLSIGNIVGGSPHVGGLAHLALWNTALNADQVAALARV
jgi:hypothetical protein